MLHDRGPRMLEDDPVVSSAVDIFVKDLNIVLDAGRASKVATPLAALAHQMFTEHLAEELRHSAFLDTRFFAGARLAGLGLSEDLVSALLPARFLAGASNSKPILPSG